jgi:hypothetical protein
MQEYELTTSTGVPYRVQLDDADAERAGLLGKRGRAENKRGRTEDKAEAEVGRVPVEDKAETSTTRPGAARRSK